MQALGDMNFQQNVEETDGIGWFTAQEVEDLETTADIKAEVRYAIELENHRVSNLGS